MAGPLASSIRCVSASSDAAALRQGGAGRARRTLADRPHRRRGAADGLGPRLPGLAQVLRTLGASARHPRRDRVRQPAADRLRRARRDRRRGSRLLPPALPMAPGAVRGAAAGRGHGTGDPRRAGGQVPPRPGSCDEPLHPLDAAPRRLLRARLVLALRALGPGALLRPARRLGRAGADPARPADDPRRHDRHRLRAACRRPRGAAGPPPPFRGQPDPGMDRRAPRRARDRLRIGRDRGLVPAAPPRRRQARRRSPSSRSWGCSPSRASWGASSGL